MRTPIAATRVAFLLTVTLVMSARYCGASSEANATAVSLEDEEDDALLDMTFDEFKERYRRLIPYMTFFVANNYVTAQTPVPQTFANEPSASPLIQRHPQRTLTRLPNIPRPRPSGKYRINPQSDKKFIPSVQYDPRELGSDNDYFTPVRYSSKINYEDYPASFYQLYQNQKSAYPEITSIIGQNAQPQENIYYTNVRPSRPYTPTTNLRDYPLRKPPVRPIPPLSLHDDYLSDYNPRPAAKLNVNYPFETLRYQGQQQKILDPLGTGRQPLPPIGQAHRNPSVNFNDLVESFQLSERLPDTLNKDNIDSSIKTLVEILNILHNSKQEEFPQTHEAPFPSHSLPPSPPLVTQIPLRHPSKVPGYDAGYKPPRPYTRPKVITETRFQATPNPLMFTDDPERFKSVPTYEQDVKPESAQQPHSYNVNSLNKGKVTEYYRPYVQDITGGGATKEAFLPTVKPQTQGKETTEHSYEITEDLSDDVLEDDRFRVTTTTEKPMTRNYVKSHSKPKAGTNHIAPHVPKTALKYGVTRGKPNVDYPAYATIPETSFSCKEQRYKGFFGDPSTGCQVWHYCDLNGGKASFLCPNGTIFSQVALTCDWWFNVKCESTTQLYVLNERLYKYILPIMPKFPEDFTGPEVDRYLEIKFKEMEAKLKEKKLKKQQEAKEKALKEKNNHQTQESVNSKQ